MESYKCPNCGYDRFTEGNIKKNYYELTCLKCKTKIAVNYWIEESREILTKVKN